MKIFYTDSLLIFNACTIVYKNNPSRPNLFTIDPYMRRLIQVEWKDIAEINIKKTMKNIDGKFDRILIWRWKRNFCRPYIVGPH